MSCLLHDAADVMAQLRSAVAISIAFLLVPLFVFAQQPATDDDGQRRGGSRLSWKDHPQVDWGELRLEFRGQFYAVNARSDGPIRNLESNSFDVARRRIAIHGAFGRRLRFQAEAELEYDDPVRDLYLDYRAARAVQIRGGRFKLPFGLEENTPHPKLEFANRSLMSNRLAPGRDDGLMLSGRAGWFQYETGVFAHDGANARPGRAVRVFGGPTAAGRISIDPFRRAKSTVADLHVAAALTHGTLPEGYPAVRGRTLFGVPFFDADLWVSGVRRRAGVELRWRPGPLAFTAETITLIDERRRQALDRSDLPPFMARGWYVSGSWVAAGATRASKVDEPRAPLFGGGWGSLQLALRHEALTFGQLGLSTAPIVPHRATSIPGSQEMATTGGLTWYANRWTRIQINVVRERLRGEVPTPAPPREIWDRVVRIQLVI